MPLKPKVYTDRAATRRGNTHHALKSPATSLVSYLGAHKPVAVCQLRPIDVRRSCSQDCGISLHSEEVIVNTAYVDSTRPIVGSPVIIQYKKSLRRHHNLPSGTSPYQRMARSSWLAAISRKRCCKYEALWCVVCLSYSSPGGVLQPHAEVLPPRKTEGNDNATRIHSSLATDPWT